MTNDAGLELFDRQGQPIDFDTYVHLFEDIRYRTIRKARVGGVRVSTVWLGMNHAYSPDSAPMIFETMVFGGRYDHDMQRYSTEAHAIAGHNRWVQKLSRPWRKGRDTTGVYLQSWEEADV